MSRLLAIIGVVIFQELIQRKQGDCLNAIEKKWFLIYFSAIFLIGFVLIILGFLLVIIIELILLPIAKIVVNCNIRKQTYENCAKLLHFLDSPAWVSWRSYWFGFRIIVICK